MAKPPPPLQFQDVIGPHPGNNHPFGVSLISGDGHTNSTVPFRNLSEKQGVRDSLVMDLREMISRHHASPAQLARSFEAKKRLGLGKAQEQFSRFPTNPTTRKGNLAEVVLAEYLVASTGSSIPVYRLRYNPNVDQSMKGDDVLAFDLDSDSFRIIVGEAKFRGTSSKKSVEEIVDGLVRSHRGGLPASLMFVADRLFELHQEDLGMRIMECAELFANNRLRLDYIGLLLSDTNSAQRVKENTPSSAIHRLAMISLGIDSPGILVDPCYEGLD